MKRLAGFLLRDTPTSTLPALGLLAVRCGFGLTMLMAHGWGKYLALMAGSSRFPDPLGIGPRASLIAVVIAEFLCSLAIVLGLFTRLATIPWVATMGIVLTIHLAGDPFEQKEKALLYLVVALTLMFTGPGRFSLDHLLFVRWRTGHTEP